MSDTSINSTGSIGSSFYTRESEKGDPGDALGNNMMPNGQMDMDGLAQHVSQNMGNDALVNERFMADINAGLSPLQQGELARLTASPNDNALYRDRNDYNDVPEEDRFGIPPNPNDRRRLPTWDSGSDILPSTSDLDDVETVSELLTPTSYSALHALPNVPGAPDKIVFSEGLQETFQSLSHKSYLTGGVQEQGGTLYVNIQTGEIGIANIGGFGSTSNEFTPNKNLISTPLAADIGVFHTHPYDVNISSTHGVDGQSYASFSATDLYRVAAGEDNVSVVNSGHNQYAMVRTSETYINVSFEQFQTTYDFILQTGLKSGLSFLDSVRDTVIILSDIYNIAYYEGSGGVLTKIGQPGPTPPDRS